MNSTRFFPDNDHLKEVRTYICPECWSKVRIVPNELFGYFGMTLHSTTPNIQLVKTRINYDIICSECDGFMFECDDMIADRIIDLNKLGIETRFCCEGHYTSLSKPLTFNKNLNIYKHRVEYPYVGFDISISENIMDRIDGLLSFQEYGFIEFKAGEEMYVLRAKFEYEDDESIKDIYNRFNDVKNNFLRFIDELIELIRYDIEEEE